MSSVTITPRPTHIEDLNLTTSPNSPTSNQYVEGVGTVPLKLIDMVRYSSFSQYANDAAAGVGGIIIGGLYWNSTSSVIKVRLT